MTANELRLSLRFVADWDRIEYVRKAVCFSASAVYTDERFQDAIGMVASELLENAVKYGRADIPIEVVVQASRDGEPDAVKVVVTNATQGPTATVDALRERIAWLKTFAHPVDAYSAALLASSEEGDEGGLGLVRIAHEARATLECDVSQAGRVQVSATCPAPPWSERPAIE